MPRVPGRDDEPTDSDPDPADDPLPAETEHAVVLHKDLIVTANTVREYDPKTADALELNDGDDNSDDGERETVHYEPGEGIPLNLARLVYSAFGDRIACLDAEMERVDTPSRGEARGDIDAGRDLATYRSGERRANAEAASDGGRAMETMADRLNGADAEEEAYACPGQFCDFVADTPQGVSAHRKHCEAPVPNDDSGGSRREDAAAEGT